MGGGRGGKKENINRFILKGRGTAKEVSFTHDDKKRKLKVRCNQE